MKFTKGDIVNHIHDKSIVIEVLSYDDSTYFQGASVYQNDFNGVELFEETDFEIDYSKKFKVYLNEIEISLAQPIHSERIKRRKESNMICCLKKQNNE